MCICRSKPLFEKLSGILLVASSVIRLFRGMAAVIGLGMFGLGGLGVYRQIYPNLRPSNWGFVPFLSKFCHYRSYDRCTIDKDKTSRKKEYNAPVTRFTQTVALGPSNLKNLLFEKAVVLQVVYAAHITNTWINLSVVG